MTAAIKRLAVSAAIVAALAIHQPRKENRVKTYRKKPIPVQAMQYDGTPESARAIIDWTRLSDTRAFMDKDADDRPALFIHTTEGTLRVTQWDYVIRGVRGEHYPCKPEIFEATYEECQP